MKHSHTRHGIAAASLVALTFAITPAAAAIVAAGQKFVVEATTDPATTFKTESLDMAFTQLHTAREQIMLTINDMARTDNSDVGMKDFKDVIVDLKKVGLVTVQKNQLIDTLEDGGFVPAYRALLDQVDKAIADINTLRKLRTGSDGSIDVTAGAAQRATQLQANFSSFSWVIIDSLRARNNQTSIATTLPATGDMTSDKARKVA